MRIQEKDANYWTMSTDIDSTVEFSVEYMNDRMKCQKIISMGYQ